MNSKYSPHFFMTDTQEGGTMGKKDIALHQYFQDERRWADLLNVYVFHGKKIVKAEDILEKDSKITGIFRYIRSQWSTEKYRDGIRRVALGTRFLLIGMEHQNRIHYAMPARVILADALNYEQQLKKFRKSHRLSKLLKGDEFLSGFSKEDRLEAVVTLVLYYGSDPWDGPRDLRDMLDFEELPSELKKFINGYPLHILEVRSYKEAEKFETDLREVFRFLQCADDKDKLKALVNEHEKEYRTVDTDAYDVMAALADSRELEKLKDSCVDEGGRIDMCLAMREWAAEERSEGRAEGRAEGRLEERKNLARNMYLRGMSRDEISAICEESMEQVAEWFREWMDGKI